MALNKESNGYIILFSVIMVVVMGVALAMVAQFTAPYQEQNAKLQKMQDILTSIGVNYGKTDNPNDIEYEREKTEEVFKQYIKGSYVYDFNGVVKNEATTDIENSDAFSLDLASELKKKLADQSFPMFVAEKNGEKLYIVPMRGMGLWNAIWGFVSIKADGKTIAGASFDHASETPGLGAEINTDAFENQFIDKTYLGNASFTSVRVVKPGIVNSSSPESKYSVDGISGGTLTSNGMDAMLKKYFYAYYNFIKTKLDATMEEQSALMSMDSTSVANDTLKMNDTTLINK